MVGQTKDVDVASKNSLVGSEVKVYGGARVIGFIPLILVYFLIFSCLFLYFNSNILILPLVFLIQVFLFVLAVRRNSLPPLTILFSLLALFLLKSQLMIKSDKFYDFLFLVSGVENGITFGWILFAFYIITIFVFIIGKLTKWNKLILISYLLALFSLICFTIQNILIFQILIDAKTSDIFGVNYILSIPASLVAIIILFFYIKNYKRDTVIYANLIKKRLNKLRKK